MQRVVVICLHGVNAVSLTCTDEDFGGHREASAIVAVMPTWWFALPSVHWSVDRRLPGRSVGDNKWAFVCDPLWDVCVSRWWWDWRVEGKPYEQAVTRYHVVGGREHNGHLKENVNNINPGLCHLFTTIFLTDDPKKPQHSQESPKTNCAAWPQLPGQHNRHYGSTPVICWHVIFDEGMYVT